MAWFDWLRRTPAPVIDHRLFGRVRAAHRPADGPWSWETLDPVPTARGDVFVNFDAGADGPGESHAAQWQRIVDTLDKLTLAAAPLAATELRDWKIPLAPADPWAQLTWEGADLCGDTKPGDQFALAYGCRDWPDAMITIYFEGDRPTLSRLDD